MKFLYLQLTMNTQNNWLPIITSCIQPWSPGIACVLITLLDSMKQPEPHQDHPWYYSINLSSVSDCAIWLSVSIQVLSKAVWNALLPQLLNQFFFALVKTMHVWVIILHLYFLFIRHKVRHTCMHGYCWQYTQVQVLICYSLSFLNSY